MFIRNEVIRLIEQENVHPIPVTEDTDLYRDLHFDSLSFVSLLTKLEDRYHITIELFEMEQWQRPISSSISRRIRVSMSF